MAVGDGGVRQKARFGLPLTLGLGAFLSTFTLAQQPAEWNPRPGKEGTLYVHNSRTAVVVFINVPTDRSLSLQEQLRQKWKGFTEADTCPSLLKTPLRPGIIDGTVEGTSMQPFTMCYAAAGRAKGMTYIVLALENLNVPTLSSHFAQTRLSKALGKKMPEMPDMGDTK